MSGRGFSHTILLACLAFSVIIIVGALAFFESGLTGRVAGDFVIEKALAGEIIRGGFLYHVGEAGALPLESEVVLSVNTLTKKMPLREVIDSSFVGLDSEVEFAPYLEVRIALSDKPSSSSVPSLVINIDGSDGDNDGDSGDGGGEDGGGGGQDGGGGAGAGSGGVSVEAGTTVAGAVISEVITGETVLRLRAGDDIQITLPAGKYGYVERVMLRGENVNNSLVALAQSGTTLQMRSLYTERVRGFSNSDLNVPLNLDKFSFTAPRKWADLHISFVFRGETFATSEHSVIVDSGAGVDIGPDGVVDSGVGIIEGVDGTLGGTIDGEWVACGERIVCGPYGSCTSPSLEGLTTLEGSVPEVVQSRTCYDEVCRVTFTDTRVCVAPTIPVNLVMMPDDNPIDDNTGNGVETPGQGTGVGVSLRPDSSRVYTYVEQDLLLYGSVTRELREDGEIRVNIRGDEHSVSVLGVDNGRVRIRVASTPQESDLLAGETRVFDIDDDRNYDLSVTVISVRGSSAVVSVAPYEGARENPLAPGEEGVALVSAQLSSPVAQVILNRDIPTLRVLLMQSGKRYPLHCYNMIKDINEAGADCGGPDCRACREEEKENGAVIWWITSFLSALLLTLIVRARRLAYVSP